MEIRMRVVPIAAALWAAHALAQSPTPAAPAPAPAPSTSPAASSTAAPAPAPESSASTAPAASTAAAAPAPTPVSVPAPSEEPTHWGILLDGGIPDGAGASAIFRPMNWLRLSAGATYNFVAFGVRGGVSVVPFYFPFSPSLNLEVGHTFGGDATPILETAFQGTGIAVPDSPLLKKVAYDYANASLGLEFGLPKTFTVFLRMGISYIQTTLHGFQELVQQAAAGEGNPPDPTITAVDPTLTVTAPGLKLGLIVFF
jgi:hypothetical protein